MAIEQLTAQLAGARGVGEGLGSIAAQAGATAGAVDKLTATAAAATATLAAVTVSTQALESLNIEVGKKNQERLAEITKYSALVQASLEGLRLAKTGLSALTATNAALGTSLLAGAAVFGAPILATVVQIKRLEDKFDDQAKNFFALNKLLVNTEARVKKLEAERRREMNIAADRADRITRQMQLLATSPEEPTSSSGAVVPSVEEQALQLRKAFKDAFERTEAARGNGD